MLFTVQIDRLDYAGAALKVMPLLEQTAWKHSAAIGATIGAIAHLPEQLLRQVFDAIPDSEKNSIIAAFAAENAAMLTAELNRLSAENRLGVTLSRLTVEQDLTITAEVSRIDYPCIAERFLPVIRQKLLSRGGAVLLLRPMIERATAEQLCTLLDRFLGAEKDAFLANLFNQNQQTLIPLIEKTAADQGIRLTVRSLSMQS